MNENYVSLKRNVALYIAEDALANILRLAKNDLAQKIADMQYKYWNKAGFFKRLFTREAYYTNAETLKRLSDAHATGNGWHLYYGIPEELALDYFGYVIRQISEIVKMAEDSCVEMIHLTFQQYDMLKSAKDRTNVTDIYEQDEW